MGFRVDDSGIRNQGSGFGFRVWGWGFDFGAEDSWFRNQVSGLRVWG